MYFDFKESDIVSTFFGSGAIQWEGVKAHLLKAIGYRFIVMLESQERYRNYLSINLHYPQ